MTWSKDECQLLKFAMDINESASIHFPECSSCSVSPHLYDTENNRRILRKTNAAFFQLELFKIPCGTVRCLNMKYWCACVCQKAESQHILVLQLKLSQCIMPYCINVIMHRFFVSPESGGRDYAFLLILHNA